MILAIFAIVILSLFVMSFVLDYKKKPLDICGSHVLITGKTRILISKTKVYYQRPTDIYNFIYGTI